MASRIFALVPAAGQGTRMGDALPKQYVPLAGRPLMFHSVETLASVPRIVSVIVILAPLDRHWGEHDWSAFPDKIEAMFAGGPRRSATVLNALKLLEDRVKKDDWILVHDAARPCLSKELVEQFIDELEDDPIGGLLAIPLADTLKCADDTQRVQKTVPRAGLWRAQTPQMFRYELLRRAIEKVPDATDESQAIEAVGFAPRLVQGENTNFKVTFAEDLPLAEGLLALRSPIPL
jgi:2-C-methyl-D-erythritol 4-phosphate cytidylyltransferase